MTGNGTCARLVAAAVAVSALFLTAGVAQAQATVPPVLGTLTLTPATGSDTTIITARTSAGCPASTNSYNIRVTGPGGFSYPVTTTGTFGFDSAGPFDVAFEQTMRDAAVLQTPAVPLVAGDYLVTLNCADNFFGVTEGTFTATLPFTSPTAYATGAPPPGGTTATTSTLAITPPGPVAAGTDSTLTATIGPAGATGTVQFRNGTTAVGSAVAVTGGTASVTAKLPSGTSSLTAAFTGTGAFASSTSAAVSYVVEAASGAGATTTPPVPPASPVTVGAELTSTSTPAATATVAPTGAGTGGALAYTGAPIVELLAAGLALVALGTALLLTARRRRLG